MKGNSEGSVWEEWTLRRVAIVETWNAKQMIMVSRKLERLQRRIIDEGRNDEDVRELWNLQRRGMFPNSWLREIGAGESGNPPKEIK